MDRLAFRFLMWLWCRRAKKDYGGPGEHGELFNTANFQCAMGRTTGDSVVSQTAINWLTAAGYSPGPGGCHWFKSIGATGS